ncbi:MAG TPA: TIGR03016 family PEP-CTERM system-associated outer membrane protein [Albitalea sp.]|nr:TIGR03016 family PEP-CTERM system-associated outer membrane protein [Albitalea sp.]
MRHPVASAAAVLAAALAPAVAGAQTWAVEAGVGTELMWTSNAELGLPGGRNDTTLDIRSHVSVHSQGRRLRVSGTAALNAITYFNHTQPSQLQPEVDLNARLEAVDGFLFVDGGVRAQQTTQNPFGALPEGGTTQNTLTTTQARLSPFIEGTTSGSQVHYLLRSDSSWTQDSGAGSATATASAARGYFGRQTVMFERDPRPLGWRFEAERSDTRYDDDTQDPVVLQLARLSVNYALGDEFSAGVHAGREHNDLADRLTQGNIYGVQARWAPSPRTTFTAFEEKRFFGKSWRLGFDHRRPQFTWNAVVSRSLDTTPQSLFDLPATNNVAGLLDSMFTTRFPDPIERGRAVRDFIDNQGLPASTLRPINLYAQRLSIVTLRSVTLGLIGRRNTATLTAFQSRTEDALESGALASGTALTNNTQYGASASLTHRLTPTMALNTSVDWTRIQALQAVGTERTTRRTARLRLNVQTTPTTNAFAGVRYRDLDSNVAVEGREGAVFVGMDHTF